MTMVESWTPRLVTRSIFISAISLGLRSSGLKAVARRASSSGFRKATPVLGAEEAGNAGLADAEEGDALDVDTMMYLKLGLWRLWVCRSTQLRVHSSLTSGRRRG